MNQVQHVKLIQTKSYEIVYYFHNQILPYISVFQCNRREIGQIIEGQKTAPINSNFVWPIIL